MDTGREDGPKEGGRLGEEEETDSERRKTERGKSEEGLNWGREKDESQEERNVYLGLANKDQTKTTKAAKWKRGREGRTDTLIHLGRHRRRRAAAFH